MLHRPLALCLVAFFCNLSLRLQGQGTLVSESVDKLLAYVTRILHSGQALTQEKVYLHFDNTGYFLGERMWFKAYVVRTGDGCPTDMSRVLYVELVSPGGDVVKKRTLRIDSLGQACGDIGLDSIYGSGFYEVRAYTRYMTNWGSDAAFSRVFPIFRAPSAAGDYVPVMDKRDYRYRLPNAREADTLKRGRLNVSFYPEGGRMVAGLESRVAFLVTDGEGRRVRMEARLTDSAGHVLSRTATDGEGRGVFDAVSGSQPLEIRLTDSQGDECRFPLPERSGSGCVLFVDVSADDSVRLSVRSTPDLSGKPLGYTLMRGGMQHGFGAFRADSGGFHKTFFRDSLPAGVNQLTVFDGCGRILAERLFFVCPRPDASDTVRVVAETPSLSPCGLVRLRVSSRPGAILSFSAMDASTLVNGRHGDIRSHLLLSSEVRGYIADPGYYFESDDSVHRRAADLLMLTQGWRRYDWEQLTWQKGFGEGAQPIEDRLYLLGHVRAGKSLPVGGIPLKVTLFGKEGIQYGETVTDSTGFYAFDLPDLYGEWGMQVTVEAEKRKGKYNVGIDRCFSPSHRRLSPEECSAIPCPFPNLSFRETVSSGMPSLALPHDTVSGHLHSLPEVDVKARRRHRVEAAKAAWQSETRGMYWADIFYDCDEETDACIDRGEGIPAFDEWLMERNGFLEGTPGWLSGLASKQAYSQSQGEYCDLKYKNRPVVWILNNVFYKITGADGVELVNEPTIEAFPTFLNEAKSVYITENEEAYRSYFHNYGLNNVVTIFVYSHDVPTLTMEKGVRRTVFQGYNKPSVFESNDYGELPPMEDFRRTLYWNPDVRIDEKGQAVVEFYNNSTCSGIYVSVEGITSDGRCVFNE